MILFIALALTITIVDDSTDFFHPLRGRRALEFLEETALLAAHPATLQKIRPALPRPAERLLQSPAPDRSVVAGRQHLRHAAAIDTRRPRVMRPIEQTIRERLLHGGLGAAERTGKEPHDRIDDHQRGQLPARQHIITDRPLLVDLMVDEPLV